VVSPALIAEPGDLRWGPDDFLAAPTKDLVITAAVPVDPTSFTVTSSSPLIRVADAHPGARTFRCRIDCTLPDGMETFQSLLKKPIFE